MSTAITAERKEFALDNSHHYSVAGPVRWIVSHAFRYPLLPLLLVATAVVNNYAYGAIQVFLGQAFDAISAAGFSLDSLARAAGGFVGVLTIPVLGILAAAGAQGLTGIARNFSVEFLAQRIERDSRDELYASLLGKSQTFHGRWAIGDIMARTTNDVRAVNTLFSPGLMLIIDSTMAVLMPMVLIVQIDPRLLLVPAGFLVALVLTVWDYNRRLEPVTVAQRDQFGVINSGLAEAVTGIEVVKSNARETFEMARFAAAARGFRDLFVRQGEIQARYIPMLVFTVAWGLAFLHALLLWDDGAISIGQVVAFMGLMGTLRFATFISIFSFNLVQMGIAGARRILELITTNTELDQNSAGRSARITGGVRFDHVDFAYDAKAVLSDISFVVEPGETVAIVGRTGSGKTTLTRLINRIYDVSAGRVSVDGVDVREWSLESLRSQISTIEQDVFLFSKTIRENIAFGLQDASFDDIVKAAGEAQADHFIREFDQGYETVIGERGVTLSGGQRQRLAIARAFLTKPRILILDDSTSAIDSATEDRIQQAMRAISKERTTFLITHRLSQIRWADRIVVIAGGRMVDQGSHEQLMERCADYRRIFARYE